MLFYDQQIPSLSSSFEEEEEEKGIEIFITGQKEMTHKDW